MGQWFNPSKSAVVWDKKNNRHIQPRERTSIEPDRQLIGRSLIAVEEQDQVSHASGSVQVVSELELLEDSPLEAELEEPPSASAGRKGKKRGG